MAVVAFSSREQVVTVGFSGASKSRSVVVHAPEQLLSGGCAVSACGTCSRHPRLIVLRDFCEHRGEVFLVPVFGSFAS